MNTLLRYTVAVVLMVYVLLQARKPTKWIGRFFLRAMNESHSGLTDWGLMHVVIKNHFSILDVGCGGGRTVRKLAAIATDGMVYGIDYAEGSVAASRAHNGQLIKSGRVAIQKGRCPNCRSLITASILSLPWRPNTTGLIWSETCARFCVF
jgi:SAM-dependent methyltransferase